MLNLNDGFNHQRPDTKAEIKHLQRMLRILGVTVEADGFYGQATKDGVTELQKQADLPQTGSTDDATWLALEKLLIKRAPQIDSSALASGTAHASTAIREDFHGDIAWIHQREGHAGKAYWPGGASGVTLDPGFDLGQQEPAQLNEYYQTILTPQQLTACHKCIGLKGHSAKAHLNTSGDLLGIRLSRDAALDVFPAVVAPYWVAIVKRFPALGDNATPGAVQTALLSLAFNRGAYNRDLATLSESIAAADWHAVARKISAMQQDHSLEGIRKRRRMEGDLITAALS